MDHQKISAAAPQPSTLNYLLYAEIELDGERRIVGAGDAILIPPNVRCTIVATEPLLFPYCCGAALFARGHTFRGTKVGCPVVCSLVVRFSPNNR
jgi:hypothetical protein